MPELSPVYVFLEDPAHPMHAHLHLANWRTVRNAGHQHFAEHPQVPWGLVGTRDAPRPSSGSVDLVEEFALQDAKISHLGKKDSQIQGILYFIGCPIGTFMLVGLKRSIKEIGSGTQISEELSGGH